MDLLTQQLISQSAYLRYLAKRYGVLEGDLFQETWCDLQAETADWSLPQPAIIRRRAWIVASNLRRTDRRRQRSEAATMPKVATDREPIEDLMLRELKVSVRSALACLSQRDRVLVRLKMVKGLGFKRIGEVLGMTPEAARKRFQRLKSKMSVHLA